MPRIASLAMRKAAVFIQLHSSQYARPGIQQTLPTWCGAELPDFFSVEFRTKAVVVEPCSTRWQRLQLQSDRRRIFEGCTYDRAGPAQRHRCCCQLAFLRSSIDSTLHEQLLSVNVNQQQACAAH